MTSKVAYTPSNKDLQVSKDFPPDKESTWKHPKEKDGWVLAHNSLRTEIKDMIECLKATSGRGSNIQAWEAKCIQTFWKAHFEHIEAHHQNEDDLFVPFLKTRFQVPDKVAVDHKELVDMMKKINGMVEDLKEGSSVKEVLATMQDYKKLMLPHLAEEEEECLPLMRAYFTPQEVSPKVQEIIGKGPKLEMGSFIYAMGQDSFRKDFMGQDQIPFFVWYIDFQFRYKHFLKEFREPLEAVQNNQEPKAPARGFWSFFLWLF